MVARVNSNHMHTGPPPQPAGLKWPRAAPLGKGCAIAYSCASTSSRAAWADPSRVQKQRGGGHLRYIRLSPWCIPVHNPVLRLPRTIPQVSGSAVENSCLPCPAGTLSNASSVSWHGVALFITTFLAPLLVMCLDQSTLFLINIVWNLCSVSLLK